MSRGTAFSQYFHCRNQLPSHTLPENTVHRNTEFPNKAKKLKDPNIHIKLLK